MSKSVEWRDIPGLEGRYKVSDSGEVLSHHGKNRVLWHNSSGYATFCYKQGAKTKNMLVHRAVALAFIDNPDSKPVVNHKDSNPKNNKVDNLEWLTQGENIEHSRLYGRADRYQNRGENSGMAKFTNEQVRKIRELQGRRKATELADKYKVNQKTIQNIWYRRTYGNA